MSGIFHCQDVNLVRIEDISSPGRVFEEVLLHNNFFAYVNRYLTSIRVP